MTPTPVYNGWIISPNFFKRAFAIMGHLLVVQIIIAIPFWLLMGAGLMAMYRTVGPLQPGTTAGTPTEQTEVIPSVQTQ